MNFVCPVSFDRIIGPIRGVPVPKGPWVSGFDLPFGMPRDLIEYFDWPSRWDVFHFIAPRQKLSEIFIKL